MSRTILKSLLCIFILVSWAWADSNSSVLSHEEYKQYLESSDAFRKADEELKTIFEKLISTLNNEVEKKMLRDEEQEWVKVRDTKAFEEGQKGSQVYIESLVKQTTDRKSVLEAKLLSLKQNPATSEALPLPPPPAKEQKTQQQAESSTKNIESSSNTSGSGFWIWIFFAVAIFIILMTLIAIHNDKKSKTEENNIPEETVNKLPSAETPKVKVPSKAETIPAGHQESKKRSASKTAKKKTFDPSKVIAEE